jgi:hypothetical protein
VVGKSGKVTVSEKIEAAAGCLQGARSKERKERSVEQQAGSSLATADSQS